MPGGIDRVSEQELDRSNVTADEMVHRDSRLWRVRWAAVGAAIAVALGGGGVFIAGAVNGPASSVVTIDPVRILDTRDPVDLGLAGPFVSPVSQKLGIVGGAVPGGATGVLLNVTVVAPSAAGFLSVRPGDASGAPATSSLNVAAGDIVPNAVQVALPTGGPNAGQIDITYDAYGTVGATADVLIDVVGYFVAGGPGGSPSGTAPRGLSAWDVIPPSVTVTGEVAWDSHNAESAVGQDLIVAQLPGVAPVRLVSGSVNFSATSGSVGDADTTCNGTVASPSAPSGKVCVYLAGSDGIVPGTLQGIESFLPTRGFAIVWTPDGTNGDAYLNATWAYTAP